MEDIAPSLLEKIQKEFQKKLEKSAKISELRSSIKNRSATYEQAQEFAVELGNILSDVFSAEINSSMLPNGKMYYNIASRIIHPMLENNYDIAADVAKSVQDIINSSAGINMSAVKPNANEDKIKGIVDIVSGSEKYDDISYMLRDPVVNFTQCAVDDTVKENADMQYKSGLSPMIIRTSSGKCCEWCDKLDGVYDYESVRDSGNNVFRRHKNCICVVELVVDKSRQNVHSKKWAEEGDVKRRIEYSFTKGKELNKKTRQQAEALQKKLKIQHMKSEG